MTAVYGDDGLVAKHSYTNDRTLIAETTLVTSGDDAVSAGDTVRFIVDGYYWGDPIVLTQADIDRGVLAVAAPELSYGEHWFRFDPIDQAGNSANGANYWPFTVSERLAPQIVGVADDVAPQTGQVPELGFTNDTVLGRHPLSAGTTVVYAPYVIHHQSGVYDRPDHFDPDRWDPARPQPPRHSYIPFGGGARKCIGDEFGTIQATLVLATVLAHWRLEHVPGPPVRPTLSIVPGPGNLRMRVTRRSA